MPWEMKHTWRTRKGLHNSLYEFVKGPLLVFLQIIFIEIVWKQKQSNEMKKTVPDLRVEIQSIKKPKTEGKTGSETYRNLKKHFICKPHQENMRHGRENLSEERQHRRNDFPNQTH